MIKKYMISLERFLIIICYYVALLPIYIKYIQKTAVIILGVLGTLVLLFAFFYPKKAKEICNFILDKRYFIATLVFIICLLFKLHM